MRVFVGSLFVLAVLRPAHAAAGVPAARAVSPVTLAPRAGSAIEVVGASGRVTTMHVVKSQTALQERLAASLASTSKTKPVFVAGDTLSGGQPLARNALMLDGRIGSTAIEVSGGEASTVSTQLRTLISEQLSRVTSLPVRLDLASRKLILADGKEILLGADRILHRLRWRTPLAPRLRLVALAPTTYARTPL